MDAKKFKKSQIVQKVSSIIEGKESVLLVNYTGIDSVGMTNFRKKLRSIKDTTFVVIKNTLNKIALNGTNFDSSKEFMKGQIGMIVTSDIVAVSRIVKECSKDKKHIQFVCISSNNKNYSNEYLDKLSSFNSADDVKASLLSVLNAPATRLVRLLNEPSSRFARLLSQQSSK
jgi:large subunit ribosomal protein L10